MAEAAMKTDYTPSLHISMISLKEAPARRRFFLDGWDAVFGPPTTTETTDNKRVLDLSATTKATLQLYEAERDPEGGLIGCTRSHLAVYKEALAQNKDFALVFEDDVKINNLFGEFVQDGKLNNLLKTMHHANWDVCRLHKTGVCKVHGALGTNSGLFHVSSLCGRAYVISKQTMEACLRAKESEVVPYTYYLAKLTPRHLTYHPSLITEGAFGSYNASGFGSEDGKGKSFFDPMTWLQSSLNYTTMLELCVANTSWYAGLTSPLYKNEKVDDAFFCADSLDLVLRNAITDNDHAADTDVIAAAKYRLHTGAYESYYETNSDLASRTWALRNTVSDPIKALHPRYEKVVSAKSHFDVTIIGAGIAGSSCYHHLTKAGARTLLLDQHSQDREVKKSKVADVADICDKQNRTLRSVLGSSGGGPRRIGLLDLAPGIRVRRAYQAWLDLQTAADGGEEDFGKLLDVLGEVIMVPIFPFGWLLLIFFLTWKCFRVLAAGSLPTKLELLWTATAVRAHLPSFEISWNCFGVFYPEAAALYADNCCEYLQKEGGNGEKKCGSKVVAIKREKPSEDGRSDILCIHLADGSSFKTHHLIIAAGAGSADMLSLLNESHELSPPLRTETRVEHFACPAYEWDKLYDKCSEKWKLVQTDEKCPLFAVPDAKIYGFPRSSVPGYTDTLYVRPNFPFTVTDSWAYLPPTLPNANVEATNGFLTNFLGVSTPDTSAITDCRYCQLGVTNTVSGPPAFGAVLDFVPGTKKQVILCSGLDGYGFKYGSIYGQEVLELMSGGSPPPGLEFVKASAAENPILQFLHKGIDVLLKNLDFVNLKSGFFVAVVAGVCWSKHPILVYLMLCGIYGVGTEFCFGRVGTSQDLKETCIVWALHFAWGLGLPFLCVLLRQIAVSQQKGEIIQISDLISTFPADLPPFSAFVLPIVMVLVALRWRFLAIRDCTNESGTRGYDRRVELFAGGQYFSDKDKDEGGATITTITTSGVYAHARHPGFSAHILQQVANAIFVCLLMGAGDETAMSVVGGMLVVSACIFHRAMMSEERVLLDEGKMGGDVSAEYADYCKKVPRRFLTNVFA